MDKLAFLCFDAPKFLYDFEMGAQNLQDKIKEHVVQRKCAPTVYFTTIYLI